MLASGDVEHDGLGFERIEEVENRGGEDEGEKVDGVIAQVAADVAE